MKRRTYFILALVLMLILSAGCTKEETFDVEESGTDFVTEPTILATVESQPVVVSQETQYMEFLNAHPEYNYYAFLDINGDGMLEMLAANEVTDGFEPVNLVDLYVCDHDGIRLGFDDLWAKYETVLYDCDNHWIALYHGGSSGNGMSFFYLDDQLEVQETSIDTRCHSVDENGNEIWTKYYNGEEVNEETLQKYEYLSNAWQTGNSESILFQAVPKAALIGTWNLYREGIPHEEGYWSDVVVSSLKLKADGTAEALLGIAVGEVYLWYTGTWTAEPVEDGRFALQLHVAGGYFDYEEPVEQETYSVCLNAEIKGECLVLEKVSGDDTCLYDFEAYERDLEFETWVERQGPAEDHITYKTLLWQYSEDAEYTLHDINKDGQDELIIREWNSYYIYTLDGTKVKSCGEYYWSYSPYCLYAYDGNGIVVHDGGSGSLHLEYVTLYSLRDAALYEEQNLFDTESHTADELQSYLSQYALIDDFVSVVDESLLDGR